MPAIGTEDAVFYRSWILANGWAEAAGLGTTMALGREAAPWLERATDAPTVFLGALAAVFLGLILEGVLVGWAQEAVLRRRVEALRSGTWVLATAIGAGLAWALGMIPSTIAALQATDAVASPPVEPSPFILYTLAAGLGLVTGPILGLAQWTVLRRHVARSARWLAANAAAWAIGMPLIFLGMDHVPWTASRLTVALSIYGVCGAVGLIVGAVHGRVLVQLLRMPIDRV